MLNKYFSSSIASKVDKWGHVSRVLVHFQVKESFEIFIKSMDFFLGKGGIHVNLKINELIRVQFEEIPEPPEHNTGLAE